MEGTMKRLRVDDYDMAYIEVGAGPALVCIHGSLNDFRIWSPVLGPLSQRRRVVAPSLRRYFPEHWDGIGPGFTIARHVADTIGFIVALDLGPVDLMGHSRGGHIAFRAAQQRPDLVRRLILAEPGGALDPSLDPEGEAARMPQLREQFEAAANVIATGDIDRGLEVFFDAEDGPGAWRAYPELVKQPLRDNARTMIGQVNEQRPPFTRADAEAVKTPTLVVGGSDTPGVLPLVLRALGRHMPNSSVVMIPNTAHMMFEQDPMRYCVAVEAFLSDE
jgi:pimeloyl-ACP methyl ester carboxylesterase